ncbi:hypothetical protein T259_4094 (plasmid) [Clostridium botulinum CDC_1436]|nr:hypothetical protein T259_4094 [Clostridium botulinum CDC_1436]
MYLKIYVSLLFEDFQAINNKLGNSPNMMAT